jgi:hypothetical protein
MWPQTCPSSTWPGPKSKLYEVPLLIDLGPPIRTIVLETSKTHYAPDRVLYARGREVERQPGMTSNYTVEGRMFLGHAIALEAWINSEGHDP